MQSANEASHFWQNIWTLLAGGGIATTIGVIAKLILDRKKPSADIHESKTRARLNEAQANNQDADTMADVFRTLRLAHKRLDEESKERRELAEKLEEKERQIKNLSDENCRLSDEVGQYKKLLKLE